MALGFPKPTLLLSVLSARDWALWRAYIKERGLPHINAAQQAAALSQMYHTSHFKGNQRKIADFMPWSNQKQPVKSTTDSRKRAEVMHEVFKLMPGAFTQVK